MTRACFPSLWCGFSLPLCSCSFSASIAQTDCSPDDSLVACSSGASIDASLGTGSSVVSLPIHQPIWRWRLRPFCSLFCLPDVGVSCLLWLWVLYCSAVSLVLSVSFGISYATRFLLGTWGYRWSAHRRLFRRGWFLVYVWPDLVHAGYFLLCEWILFLMEEKSILNDSMMACRADSILVQVTTIKLTKKN